MDDAEEEQFYDTFEDVSVHGRLLLGSLAVESAAQMALLHTTYYQQEKIDNTSTKTAQPQASAGSAQSQAPCKTYAIPQLQLLPRDDAPARLTAQSEQLQLPIQCEDKLVSRRISYNNDSPARGTETESTLTNDFDVKTRLLHHDTSVQPLSTSSHIIPRLVLSELEMDVSGQEDLFIQEAEVNENARSSRVGGYMSRGIHHDKRHSLPASEFRSFTSLDDRRPRTSGGLGSTRTSSRLGLTQSRHERTDEDSASIASFGGRHSITRRGSQYATDRQQQQQSPRSPRDTERSPETSMFGRLRFTPSATSKKASQLISRLQESEVESPIGSSEQRQSVPESTSADSQTAPSTVWDELDDLKSRIKKLELTGKLPPTSSAAVGEAERPRTATTAPTTIDSSPKREKKDEEEPAQSTSVDVESIHPLLHAALKKAKPLLNPSLYRSLNATAADALQLAATTTTPFSISTDRSLRRKADSMCRNLTDLCLALCEGKHEISSSPLSIDTARPQYSRAASRMEPDARASRPLSRLEARRSSILGAGPDTSVSPRRDRDDQSEVDTPSQYLPVDRRRFARSSSRVSTTRTSRYEESDEDPTIRPPSRNGSEFSFRNKPLREYGHTPQRSVSLREALSNRRPSGAGPRELPRITSMSSDNGRRWTRESTPPVLEEEVQGQDAETSLSLPRQRLGSFGHLRQNRGLKDSPLRSSSISRSRQSALME